MFHIDIVGLRNARGRFERMSVGGGLVALQLERAAILAEQVGEEARRLAPRARRHSDESGRQPFWESLSAAATPEPTGFRIELHTDQPDLRRWLREGTKPHEINAINASALRFTNSDGTLLFRRTVHHPGTSANDWESRLLDLVRAEARVAAGQIGSRMAQSLAGRP